MGEQIKLARLRRNLATELVAERAGISRATLWAVEKGSPTVAIGAYAAVLHALGGMDKDLELVARDDVFGRKLQDLNLPSHYPSGHIPFGSRHISSKYPPHQSGMPCHPYSR